MIGLRTALALLAAAGLIAAGCGDDDEDEGNGSGDGEPTAESAVSAPGTEGAAALQEEIADLDDEEQVTRVGDEWADLFGNADEAMCGYLHPDLGLGEGSCGLYVQGALTQDSKLQASFAGATVEGVEIDGETALAEFSNGHRVALVKDSDGAWRVLETPRTESSGSKQVVEPG